MQSFLVTLLICSITMSGLALLYMAATPFLEKRYSSKGRYYVWLIIMVGLIIPFRPQWGNALFSVDVPASTPPPVIQTNGEVPGYVIPPTNLPNITLPSVEYVVVSETAVNISWWQVGFAVWAAGFIMFIAYHGIKHYRFGKIARRWSEQITDGHILSLLESLKSEMGIKRRIPIYLCAFVGSPMMIGLFKPRILLPTIELAQDELCFIIKHELVHYRRKDLLCKYLIMAATAVHWFNPVVYMMARAVNTLCETSCDSEVLRNADENTRQSYGETIIGVVQYHSKLKTALSTNFYGGKKGMKNRISSIMDMSKKRMGAIILTGALVLTIGTGFMVAINTVSANAQEPVTGNIATFEIDPNTQEVATNNTAVLEANTDFDTNAPTSQNRRSSILIFAEYEEWGLTIEGLSPHADGGFIATATQNVFYQGQLIRGFSDFGHGVYMSISSYDQGGDMWIHVIRDADGNIERFDTE